MLCQDGAFDRRDKTVIAHQPTNQNTLTTSIGNSGAVGGSIVPEREERLLPNGEQPAQSRGTGFAFLVAGEDGHLGLPILLSTAGVKRKTKEPVVAGAVNGVEIAIGVGSRRAGIDGRVETTKGQRHRSPRHTRLRTKAAARHQRVGEGALAVKECGRRLRALNSVGRPKPTDANGAQLPIISDKRILHHDTSLPEVRLETHVHAVRHPRVEDQPGTT